MKTKTKSKYKSEAFQAIHSAVEGMYRSETIDKATMRHFDEACLAGRDMKQAELADKLGMNQGDLSS